MYWLYFVLLIITDDGDTITEEHILPSLAQHTTVNNELRYGTMRSQVRHGSRSNSPCYRPNNTSVEPHMLVSYKYANEIKILRLKIYVFNDNSYY